MQPWLPALTMLEYLDASVNALTGTISALSGIPRLRTFSVGLNKLSGNLPADWLSQSEIREFDAVSNR